MRKMTRPIHDVVLALNARERRRAKYANARGRGAPSGAHLAGAGALISLHPRIDEAVGEVGQQVHQHDEARR